MAVSVLDNSVTSIALPTIARDLSANPGLSIWAAAMMGVNGAVLRHNWPRRLWTTDRL